MGTVRFCNRRDWLKQGAFVLASTLHLADQANPVQNGQGRGAIPGFIDAHVHVWTNNTAKYPFKPGVANVRPAVFTPEDILQRARPSGVTRVVLVQVSYYGFDNSYLLAALHQWPEVFRGIAVVNQATARPDVEMLRLAASGVRGFRIYGPAQSSDAWLAGEGFDKMFRCGAQHGLAMCLLANPQDLADVELKCREFPGTPVVIDHMARIGKDGPIREADVQSLCALARHSQVKVKVSAFYALGNKRPPHTELVPLVRRLYEAFGPQRLMWASDCPFQVEHETYEASISLVRDRLDFLSREDKDWLLRRTAEATFFY